MAEVGENQAPQSISRHGFLKLLLPFSSALLSLLAGIKLGSKYREDSNFISHDFNMLLDRAVCAELISEAKSGKYNYLLQTKIENPIDLSNTLTKEFTKLKQLTGARVLVGKLTGHDTPTLITAGNAPDTFYPGSLLKIPILQAAIGFIAQDSTLTYSEQMQKITNIITLSQNSEMNELVEKFIPDRYGKTLVEKVATIMERNDIPTIGGPEALPRQTSLVKFAEYISSFTQILDPAINEGLELKPKSGANNWGLATAIIDQNKYQLNNPLLFKLGWLPVGDESWNSFLFISGDNYIVGYSRGPADDTKNLHQAMIVSGAAFTAFVHTTETISAKP